MADVELDTLPELVGQRYRVERLLGEGAMGQVYLAYDTRDEIWCALKVLAAKYQRKKKIRKRFETEAVLTKQLEHRNIIGILDMDMEASPPYMVLELAEGGCLIDWIEKNGTLPPKMAVDVAIQICKGLGVAHDAGVVHRDVKPHNILMNHRGVCKLTDFGIAHVEERGPDLTRTGSTLGTLGYMAPEQRTSAKHVDHRADIYAVGAALYAMLVGEAAPDLFMAERDRDLMTHVPEDLVPVILKATQYDPKDRYQSIHDLARALHDTRAELPANPKGTPDLAMVREETGEVPLVSAESTFVVQEDTPPVVQRVPSWSLDLDAFSDAGDTTVTMAIRTMRRRKLWVVGVVAAAVLLVLMVAMIDAGRTLGQARRAHERARGAYFAELTTSVEVVEELAALGGDAARVEAAWNRWDASTSRHEKDLAAREYTAIVAVEVRDHASDVEGVSATLADSATRRVVRLQEAEEAADRAAVAAHPVGCGG